MTRYAALAVACLLTGATACSWGQVYKHVDKNGRVIYTDTPPQPGQAASAVPIQKQTEAERLASEQSRKRFLEDQARKREEEEKAAAQRKRECDRLYSLRTQLKLPGPFSMPLPEGATLVVTGAKKLDMLKSVEADIAAKCR